MVTWRSCCRDISCFRGLLYAELIFLGRGQSAGAIQETQWGFMAKTALQVPGLNKQLKKQKSDSLILICSTESQRVTKSVCNILQGVSVEPGCLQVCHQHEGILREARAQKRNHLCILLWGKHVLGDFPTAQKYRVKVQVQLWGGIE